MPNHFRDPPTGTTTLDPTLPPGNPPSRLRQVFHFAAEFDPGVLGVLVDRARRRRKIRVGEHTDGDGNEALALACFPQHHAAAIAAEVVRHFTVLDPATVGIVIAADLHPALRIPGAKAERRSGAALAMRAVAQADNQRFAVGLGAELPTGAMRGARCHGPNSFD